MGRVFISLFFLIFAVAGGAMFVGMGYDIYRNVKAYTWKEATCTVVSSDITEESNHTKFLLRYRYLVDGKEYQSDRYRFSTESSEKKSKMESLKFRYQPGTEFICYYNPSSPEEAIVKRGAIWMILTLLFPLVFLAVGLGGLYGVWIYKTPEPGQRSISTNKKKDFGKAIGFIFFGIFALAGGLFLYFLFGPATWHWFQAKSWPESPCKILTSSVARHSSSDDTTYSVDVLYSYEVNGREYKSDNYEFIGGSSSGYSAKKKIADNLKVGSIVPCYVNPNNPEQSVLSRDWMPMMWIGLIPLFLFLIGASGLLRLLKSKNATNIDPVTGLTTFNTAARSPSGDYELKAPLSPLGKFLGIVFVALFWNGIVSVFLYGGVYQNWSTVSWFLLIFLTPFVLIGLLLIVGIFTGFFALFNPRPHIYVTDLTPQLGTRMKVRWEFDGKSERIAGVILKIEAQEIASYRRGTDTVTDTKTFYSKELFKGSSTGFLAKGECQLEIPRDSMHTFNGSNNKITWKIHLEVDIKGLPDIKEEYPLTVRPLQQMQL